MVVLPPGTLLQLMYLRKRIRLLQPGHFIEIGPGSGEITQLLLDNGWTGRSYDLEPATIDRLKQRFSAEIAQSRYQAVNADYLSSDQPDKADLVISCMVMEHLEDDVQQTFMETSMARLTRAGLMIGLVPSSPDHWGIEDDIAGHCRRYTRDSLRTLTSANGWEMQHTVGLTYPISNWLLPISNFLVNRSEHSKLKLSLVERTRQSGRREVNFKTHFPAIFGLLLNEISMYPFYLLQRLFKNSERSLVLYFEARPLPDEEYLASRSAAGSC